MDIEIGAKDNVPLIQNSVTKRLAYSLIINAMVLIDTVFILSFFREIPTIAVVIVLVKFVVACLFLGYLRTLNFRK